MRACPLLATALLVGCGVTSRARPVPLGSWNLEAAAGGPIVRPGIPLPLATVGVSHGIAERADVSAHAHLSTWAAFNRPGFDIGAAWMPFEQRGLSPAWTFGMRLYAFTDFRTGGLWYSDASATASWQFGPWTSFANLTAQTNYLDRHTALSPGLGIERAFGRFSATVEARWYDPFYSTGNSPVPWLSPFGQGALGLLLGARYAL